MIPGADDDEDDDILCVPPPDAASIRSAFVDGDPLSTMQEPSTSKPKRVVSTCVNINIVNNSGKLLLFNPYSDRPVHIYILRIF